MSAWLLLAPLLALLFLLWTCAEVSGRIDERG